MKEQTAAVQRMQDYIEAHLEADITLAQLSAVSLFSPWHSYRLFKELLGVTEAAFDCGFGSVDGYIRAFYREFGCRPGEYLKDPVPIALFIPYGVKFGELRKDVLDMEMKNLQSVFIQVIRKPKRKVIIKRGIKAEDYFAYCDEVSCEV